MGKLGFRPCWQSPDKCLSSALSGRKRAFDSTCMHLIGTVKLLFNLCHKKELVMRFDVRSKLDLTTDNTRYRVVLTRGKQYADGELAEWLAKDLHQGKPVTDSFPSSFPEEELNTMFQDLDTACEDFASAEKGGRVVIMIVAIPAAGGSSKVRFASIRTSGVTDVTASVMTRELEARFPSGDWVVYFIRVSLPRKKDDIPTEVQAFKSNLRKRNSGGGRVG